MKDIPAKAANNQGVNGKDAGRTALGRFRPGPAPRDPGGRFAGPVGPHSPTTRILGVDKRTVVGRLLLLFRDELTEHLGGEARLTFPKRCLIRTASVRAVRLSILERDVLLGEASSEAERRWSLHANGLRRDLLALGLDPAVADDTPRLRDMLAAAAARGRGH